MLVGLVSPCFVCLSFLVSHIASFAPHSLGQTCPHLLGAHCLSVLLLDYVLVSPALTPLGGWCSVGKAWVRASRPALLTGQHYWLAAMGGPLPVFATSATVRLTHYPWLLWDTCTLSVHLCPARAFPFLTLPCLVLTLIPTCFLLVRLACGLHALVP